MKIAFGSWAIGVVGICLAGCGSGSGSAPDGGAGTAGGSHADGAAGTGGHATGTGGGAGTAGGGATGSCGQVEPCGGVLTGTWAFTADCVNSASLQPTAEMLCATASIGAVTASVSGSVSFNSDLTYDISQTETVVIPWTIPSSCTAGATCAGFGANTQAKLDTGETFVCSGTSTCACTQTAMSVTTDSGTYATTGTGLALISAITGDTTSGGYCVQGSTLHVITVDGTMNMGPMGQATIDEDVTAVKQ
jgi:hypothetical protein